MNRRLLALVCCILTFAGLLLGLSYLFWPSEQATHWKAYAQACCGIHTNNEAAPPGDWDATYTYNEPPPGGMNWISRTTSYKVGGSYSYEHRCDATDSYSWAWTYVTCTTESLYGYADGWVRFEDDFGHAQEYPVFSLGDDDDSGVGSFNWGYAWDVYYDDFNKALRLACDNCNPAADWMLDVMIPETWYHVRVEWGLPISATNGYMYAWLGTQALEDRLVVAETGLTTDTDAAGVDQNAFGAGVGGWHYLHCDEKAVYVDDVDMSFCAPDPTPTPDPGLGDCDRYGHAAVINVDADCDGVLRFNAVPNTVPREAFVERATLMLYGVAMEQAGETIYIAPLQVLWGEMTCDWCRRTVGEDWALPGATAVPEDRYPNKVAEFTTALGWISVDIPPYLVEEWALTSAANPGLILFNEDLTGKFGIASSEWIEEDYGPYIVIYYFE